jgi:hypothetical protein
VGNVIPHPSIAHKFANKSCGAHPEPMAPFLHLQRRRTPAKLCFPPFREDSPQIHLGTELLFLCVAENAHQLPPAMAGVCLEKKVGKKWPGLYLGLSCSMICY